MFLEVLNNKEKELFLSLAYNLSAVDKDFSPAERTIVSSYCHEMYITLDMDKIDFSVEKVLDEMNELCSVQNKRIIIFECMRLAIADSDYDEDERKIVRTAIEKFGLDMEYHDKCEAVRNDFTALCDKIGEIVSE